MVNDFERKNAYISGAKIAVNYNSKWHSNSNFEKYNSG
jgi:hypothetical protein